MNDIPYPILFCLLGIVGYVFFGILTARVSRNYYILKGRTRDVREKKHIENGFYWPVLLTYNLLGFPVDWFSRFWLWNQRRKLVDTLERRKHLLSLCEQHFSQSDVEFEKRLVFEAEKALDDFDATRERLPTI